MENKTPPPTSTGNVSQSVNSISLAIPVKPNNEENVGFTLLVNPPDGGWGWMVLSASFLINFIMDGTIYSLGLFLEEIANFMKTYPTRVAYASSILLGINLLTAPIISGLINKYGFRIITFVGGIMASLVLLVSSFLTELNLFLFIFGGFGGVACACIYIPSIVIVGFYFEKWRALASAICVCGSSCGIIFYPLILNSLREYHWTVKFRLLSLSFLFVPIFSLTFKPLPIITLLPAVEQEDSVLSVNLEGDHTKVLSQIYNKILCPTPTQTQEISPQIQNIENVRKNISTSSTLVAISGFPGGSGTFISRMTTVFEEEGKLSFRNKCRMFWRRCGDCCRSRKYGATSTISRPMYRDDIFFTGSIFSLPEYPKKPSIKGTVSSIGGTISRKSAIDYQQSVTRVATQRDLQEEEKPFVCCPEALRRTIATMLDFSLLKSPSFVCLTISGFLVSLGMYVPFVYIIQKALQDRIELKIAAMMVTGLGIANLCGRILCGILASIPQVNALVVTYIGLFIAGVPAIFIAFSADVRMYYVLMSLHGSAIATVPAMKTLILVDLLGLDKLTNSFGITLMFQGISNFIGLPLAGYFIESTKSYNASFIYCGCTTILSGVMLLPMDYIKSWEKKKAAL